MKIPSWINWETYEPSNKFKLFSLAYVALISIISLFLLLPQFFIEGKNSNANKCWVDSIADNIFIWAIVSSVLICMCLSLKSRNAVLLWLTKFSLISLRSLAYLFFGFFIWNPSKSTIEILCNYNGVQIFVTAFIITFVAEQLIKRTFKFLEKNS